MSGGDFAFALNKAPPCERGGKTSGSTSQRGGREGSRRGCAAQRGLFVRKIVREAVGWRTGGAPAERCAARPEVTGWRAALGREQRGAVPRGETSEATRPSGEEFGRSPRGYGDTPGLVSVHESLGSSGVGQTCLHRCLDRSIRPSVEILRDGRRRLKALSSREDPVRSLEVPGGECRGHLRPCAPRMIQLLRWCHGLSAFPCESRLAILRHGKVLTPR
jgi:hypothetical protein